MSEFDTKTSELHQALAYWRQKRGARSMPLRADIDPVEMRAWLPATFLADVRFDAETQAPNDIFFRVAGGIVGRLYGMELTNRSLSDIDMDGYRCQGLANYVRVIEDGQPKYSLSRYTDHDGHPHGYELLLMPIASTGERCDMLLGVMMKLESDPAQQDGIWVYDV